MDSESYPLIDLYCEDDIAKKIINQAIENIQLIPEFKSYSRLINTIICGPANKTYDFFICHKETYDKSIRAGYACLLDGDMRNKIDREGNLQYQSNDGLLDFIYSEEPPEKFLTKAYLSTNPNSKIQYHVDNSNPHCLFDKLIEDNIVIDKNKAFEICWNAFVSTTDGITYFNELQNFIINACKKFAKEL